MIERIIRKGEGTVVDVRTRAEFQGGHVPGSVNIPVNELAMRADELRSLKQPLVLCCASGSRSGMAAQMLHRLGIESYDAGSWLSVNYFQNQTVTEL
jgi:phage shock protein E